VLYAECTTCTIFIVGEIIQDPLEKSVASDYAKVN